LPPNSQSAQKFKAGLPAEETKKRLLTRRFFFAAH